MGKNIIEVKNIKTGEVLEFTGQNAVAKYLTGVYGKKIYAGAVASAIRPVSYTHLTLPTT